MEKEVYLERCICCGQPRNKYKHKLCPECMDYGFSVSTDKEENENLDNLYERSLQGRELYS